MRQKLLLTTALLCGFLWIHQGSAQVLNAPEAAPNQTPPAGSTPWSAACASPSFNDYWAQFTWGPPLVNSDNEFILELSDANGSFTNATELARDDSKNTTFDFYFQFSLPQDTRGEGYRLRVRSTSPAVVGPASVPYPMYYLDINSALTIRPQGQADFGDGTAEVCDGNSITLEVYNLSNADTYQYNWYRSGTPLAETGPSITVTQSGMYNVEIDYGACSGSGNTLSNLIDVTAGTSLGVAINPPANTALCSGETLALEANITGQGLTYTWFKDGAAITSPTVDDSSYLVDAGIVGFEGDYQVEIFGAGACLERSAAVVITNAGNFTVTRDNPGNMVVLPGQDITLSISTDASGETYQWYRDGNPVSGATTSTLVVSDAETGTYFARVTLSGGSCTNTSIDSEPTTVVAPASLEMDITYNGSYSACTNTSVVLEVLQITALVNGVNSTDVTSDVVGDDLSENGAYHLDGSISSYSPTSNTLSVQLRVNETLEISSTDVTVCGPSEPITISTERDLTGESYMWYRDGVDINETAASIEVSTPGIYQLVLMREGCPVPSNEIALNSLDENLISLNPGDDIRIPEGTSRTVTASGADSYRWFDDNNLEISNSASVALTLEGTYLLLANLGGCEVSRAVTVTYLDTFRVPNVISVNGDGINDQWMIPNSYSGRPDVNVTIYNESGEEVLNINNYQNDWPSASDAFPRQNMVFYYRIRNSEETLKQGTITVIR
ncbi:MAG: gliding motility-associated C-terminal domain-containing protein [Robiginitalea sp.]